MRLMRTASAVAAFICALSSAHGQPTAPFNVRNFGAAGDGAQSDTEAINKAIQAASQAGGGTVLVPAGKYLTGTVQLQSNVTLWIDAGATLLGTSNLSEYRWPQGGREWDGAIILANGVRNVALMGRGTINGQNLNNPRGEEHIRGPHAVLFNNSKDVVVRDITIRDSGNYSLIFRSCERVTIDNFSAYNGYDGINMHDVRQATISNCKLYTGDDSLAGAYWENVTVTNCILNSSCNAIRVGGRNVLISNTLIYGPGEFAHRLGFRTNTESGFQILPHSAGRGGGNSSRLVTPGPVDNMVLSNITMMNVRSPVFIAFGADAPYSGNNLGVGRIVIENLTALNCGRTPFYVAGPREKPAKSIILRNARLTYAGGVNEEESNGQGFSPYSMIQAYGVYCRNVENLELHDVRLDYSAKDGRPALFGENVGTVELDRFTAERDPEGAPSLLFDGIRKLIRNGQEAASTSAMVKSFDPLGKLVASEPFLVRTIVHNPGAAGLGDVALQWGPETVHRTAWLDANETTHVTFANLRSKESGAIAVKAGAESRSATIAAKPAGHPVAAPYVAFQNLQGQVQQVDGGFYIRENGDYAVLDHGDQYGAAYLPRGLGDSGSVLVKLENADSRTNWVGRTGIMVRKDISKPGQAPGYLILGASPANGFALEWDSDGDGRIDRRTALDGYTNWPCWIKLERHGAKFTGYSSKDGVAWTKVGEAGVPGADGPLDVGVFAHRSSARFMDFQVTKLP